ncbi:MAG: ATP-binding protein [Treponema sp.]|jgi:hypothetical protein|nr:ATP-binding protein [Treponema sp.]
MKKTKTFKTHGRLLSQVFSSYNTTFDALCELINNSIQAKSTEIKIEADLVDDADGPNPYPFTEYRIIDNGEGVANSEFDRKIFEIATDVKNSKGIGRFAAFQIGSTVTINTTAHDNQTNKYTNTSVTLDANLFTINDIAGYDPVIDTSELENKPKTTSYKVTIKNFWNEIEKEKYPKRKLVSKLIPGNLEEAIFLRYSSYIVTDKITFLVNGKKISKDDFLVGEIENDRFEYTFSDDSTEQVSLEYVNYKGKKKKVILAYRVDNNEIKTIAYEDSLGIDYPYESSWIVYIDCNYFNTKTDTIRNMPLDDLDEDLTKLKKQVKNTVRDFIRSKHKNYFIFVEKLKGDKYYPYKGGSPSSSKEYTFNHLAYFIEEDYLLIRNDDDKRKIIYPLLDRAMSNGDIIDILENILSLDNEKVKLFKELLEMSYLPEVIRFTTELAKKQIFLEFLNEIVYGDTGKYLKERSQLHRIIEKNLWIFGEEYNTTPILFSDKSIKNNLDELRSKYFRYQKSEDDGNYNDITDKSILDITDLFFYNEKPLDNGKREIMIVELKAPIVKISQKELYQVDKYKYDIEHLDKFSKHQNQYKIILVSTGITPFGESKIGVINEQIPTLYTKSKDVNIEVHVMKWSDIIAKNKHRLSYLSDYLETKDINVKNMFEKNYPELDISNLTIPIKKSKK